MTERNTLVRSLHDIGLAAWFGGSLMGAVGLNGAAAAAKDTTERSDLASVGWAKWTPWNAAAIGAHLAGAYGLLQANNERVASQRGVGVNPPPRRRCSARPSLLRPTRGCLARRSRSRARCRLRARPTQTPPRLRRLRRR